MSSILSPSKMDSISSSFLQKQAIITSSCLASPPLPLVNFKISSLQTYERPKTSQGTRSSPWPLHPTKQGRGETITRKERSLLSTVFNSLENFICNFIDPPLHSSIDPDHVLSGNFAPVDELPPTMCEVEQGSLLPCLNGTYIRNGPNPQFIPKGPYHMFDGDGMLHALKISGGKATLCSRFIKTYKYMLEKEAGFPVMLNVFSAFNGLAASIARCTLTFLRVISGEYDPKRGIGTANTSLAMLNRGLFALGESDLPYRIKLTSDGDVITLGRHESFGQPFITMTAHPKIDADTREAFAFRQSITFTSPFLIYFKIDSQGRKQAEVPIYSLKETSLIHDFAVSKSYAIFPDSQLVMRPQNILKGIPAMSVDVKKVSRLGIIPRNATDGEELLWIDVAGFNMIHAVNAWDEDGSEKVVMVATNLLGVENLFEGVDLTHASLERVEIDLKEKRVNRRALSMASLDFSVINPAFVGKKNRYVYAAIGNPMPKITGIVKIDLSLSTTDCGDCAVASRIYGAGCYGGEAIFAPRDPENPAAEEDDGYLLTYLHNENTGESKFLVMDAKSPTLEIVALVKLPARVPYGFHGIFIPQNDLTKSLN